MTLSFEIAGGQIDGARDYQEDAFLITHLGENAALIVVADGMGGHAAGNVASNMAVQAFNKHVSSNFPAEFPHEVLNGAVLKANHSIAETIKETPALDGMGCTMVAALLQGNNIWWASVGDSHIYLLRNRELNKINADHSYGGFLDAMAKAGTPVEPEPGLARNMLMSAITGVEIADIDCPTSPLQLQHGDKILLCSDGMDTLSDGKIIQYSEWSESPKECVDALLNAVEEAESPKQDNTTVLVINVVDKAVQAGATAQVEEEKDDEDITDTQGSERARASKLDATAEMITEVPQEPEEIDVGLPEPELKPETPAPTAAPVTVTHEEIPETESNTGKIIGIAAAVIIAVAIGGYFMLGKDKAPAVEFEPDVTDVTPVEPEEEIITDTETIPEEETVVEETEPAITEPEPAVIAEEPVAEPEPAPAAEPTVDIKGKEFTDALKSGGNGPEMVWIPAGSFDMGSPSTSVYADERPQHTVKIKKFAISKYEVTFSEYDKFAKATGRKLPDNMYMDRATTPVIFVSWDDAYNYARWLSEETGKKYRLPSEAEWEYAASGGKSTPFWWGFNEELGKAHCFTCESQFDPRKPTKIGSFQPNQFGIHDTAGNVAEWVHDCWHDSYKGAPDDGSVWEGGDCTQRVARGGSYMSPQQSIRTAKRDKFKSNTGYDHLGIRVVREE